MSQDPKTLNVHNSSDLQQKVSDVEVTGNPDQWRLLCKASSQSQGWMKSTKVCFVPTGAIVQVTTQQRNPDGTYALAEALTFVPGKADQLEKHFFPTIHKPATPTMDGPSWG